MLLYLDERREQIAIIPPAILHGMLGQQPGLRLCQESQGLI